MQASCDCTGTLGFTGTCRSAHQEIAHLHGFTGSDLCVPANIDYLLRDDVPGIQFGNQTLFQNRKLPTGSKLILPFKISMGDFRFGCTYRCPASLGEDREFTCHDVAGSIGTGIQLRLGYPQDITGLFDFRLDICRAGFILQAAVCVITKDGHILYRLRKIRIASLSLIEVEYKIVFKLLISDQCRKHSHKDSSTIICSLVQPVGFDHFRVLVIAAGNDIAACAVIDNQMIGIRTGGGFVFCNHPMINDTHCAFCAAGHTVTDCMYSLDDCGSQRGLGSGAVFRRHLHFFTGKCVHRCRKRP